MEDDRDRSMYSHEIEIKPVMEEDRDRSMYSHEIEIKPVMEEDRDRSMSNTRGIAIGAEEDPDRSMANSDHDNAIGSEDDPDINVVFREIKNQISTLTGGQSSTSPSGQPQYGKIRIVPHDIGDFMSSSSSSLRESSPSVQNHHQENTRSPYTPRIISIGSVHHGKEQVPQQSIMKYIYLKSLLNRRDENLINDVPSRDEEVDDRLRQFIQAAIDMNDVQGHYDLNIPKHDFVKMLVIDGCFLLEFLFTWTKTFDYMIENLVSKDVLQYILRVGNMINHDILLFENQIPFSVLQKFYDILRKHGKYSTDHSMVKLAYDYQYKTSKWEKSIMTFLGPNYDKSIYEMSEPSNLLHLYHMMLFSKNQKPQHPTSIHKIFFADSNNHPRPPIIESKIRCFRKCTMTLFSCLFAIVSSPLYFIHIIFFANITYPTNLISATEIEEAGVRLEGSRVDLRFDKGTLLIPVLTLNQQSLCLLQNLLFFEFDNKSIKSVEPYVHNYLSFLSLLIKNPGDLKVLEKHNIIITSDGGDESFALVNKLIQAGFKELMEKPHHHEIQSGLKKYCKKPRHRWRAKLMKDYFGNPWSILGVLVGVILLVLTLIQTLFTVKSYYHQ